MEFEPMLTPREKSPLPENVPRGVSNPRHFGSEPKHYQLSYSGPTDMLINIPTIEMLFYLRIKHFVNPVWSVLVPNVASECHVSYRGMALVWVCNL